MSARPAPDRTRAGRRFLRALRDQPVVLAACVRILRGLREIGLLRSRRIYSHVPFHGIVDVDCGADRRFLIESRGHAIENGLFWEGLRAHEPHTMALWIARARTARCVLDIGANSGVFSLAAAAAGARAVHAFEPLPRMARTLQHNIRLNGFTHVHAWPVAVGAVDGSATLFDPGGDAPASASLSAEFARSHFGDLPASPVRVVAIDTWRAAHAVDGIDLVKIDVEGYEESVLLGLRDTVARWRPSIVMEVLEGQEESLRAAVESHWPGFYIWSRIDEGDGAASRNVWLDPVRG